eukprot:164440-Prymnesium_polylepis.2
MSDFVRITGYRCPAWWVTDAGADAACPTTMGQLRPVPTREPSRGNPQTSFAHLGRFIDLFIKITGIFREAKLSRCSAIEHCVDYAWHWAGCGDT